LNYPSNSFIEDLLKLDKTAWGVSVTFVPKLSVYDSKEWQCWQLYIWRLLSYINRKAKAMECVNKLKNFTHSVFIVSAWLQNLCYWIFDWKCRLYEDRCKNSSKCIQV